MATPWNKIRAEWLKGGITQKALAEKYGVSVKTIQNRAYKEGWKKQKGKIREKVEEKLCERVVRARVTHLEKLIQAQEDVLDGLLQLAADIKKEPKNMLRDKQLTIRNAESITRALQTATMTQRDLYGLKNIDQKFADKKWRAEQKEKKAEANELTGTVWRIETEEEVPLDE